ncbi:MAG: succinate dehydrogenase cytochrome b subunit [Crocinitomicaceae bacterium]|nr:succinate dehydrogenase cytochrome b subunit [Crocinitomicaceae bacterium]
MSNSALLKSSLAKKYWMSITGLFLILFLVGHLAGNIPLMFEINKDTAHGFNQYAKFMSENPLVQIVAWIVKIAIIFHAVDGVLLTMQNQKARPVKYKVENANANSSWFSRSMMPMGLLIFAFVTIHLVNFWAKMHYGDIPTYKMHGEEYTDLYTVVMKFFGKDDLAILWIAIYILGMVALSFHLIHGFASAFQSVGLRHKKYTPIIEKVGYAFAIIVPLIFALIPIVIHIRVNG